ncbi:MAG: zf-HC2 domain-containing protein [Planctomycetes bacterium]|nr:zf-HC2 domain-containing protein [Planctomycetota bacterium]
MRCEEARDLIPAHALGDLDAEPRRALEEHLGGCAVCRAESERTSRAAKALAELPAIETAEARRDRAVAAMAREHADRVQGILLLPRRRRRIIFAAAAALLLVAGGAAWLLAPRDSSYSLRISEVRGRAQCLEGGSWKLLQPGMRLRRGDRIATEAESVVTAEIWGGARVGRLCVNQNSAVAIGPDRTFDLERGEIYGEIAGGEPLRIRTFGNDAIVVRSGRFEAGLRETVSAVLGISIKRPHKIEGADLVFEDRPFGEVADEVARIAGRPVRADEAVRQRRVWFYGMRSRGPELLAELRAQVQDQGIWLRRDGEAFVAGLSLTAERRETGRHLFARVAEGDASIASSGGAIRLAGGEEGTVQPGGTPSKRPARAAETPWLRPDYYTSRRRLDLPGALALRIVGKDAQGRPIVECSVEGAEILAVLDGETAAIVVESATQTGAGEFVVPVRIRFEKK